MTQLTEKYWQHQSKARISSYLVPTKERIISFSPLLLLSISSKILKYSLQPNVIYASFLSCIQ